MQLCYVDESGCTGVIPTATSLIQPVFAIAGLVVNHACLHQLTRDFLQLKRRFFPAARPPGAMHLEWVLYEVKGADLRKQAVDPSHRKRRHALGFLDSFVALLETHQVRVLGRIWIKGIGTPFDGRAVYTSSMQTICAGFQELLRTTGDVGFVISDSRNKPKNANVAHSIFTKKFKASGDEYPNILEMVTFGHSENHAGLQLADLLCSAILFPLATYSFCHPHIQSVHVRSEYLSLKRRYGQRLRQLQFRYQDDAGRWRGGIVVADAIGRQPGSQLF
jgi:hypothetical protein